VEEEMSAPQGGWNFGWSGTVAIVAVVGGVLVLAAMDKLPAEMFGVRWTSSPPSPVQPPSQLTSPIPTPSLPTPPVVKNESIPVPSPTLETRLSPIQFVRDYYATVNAKEIDKAWGMLTTKFQNGVLTSDYSGFSNWWKSVDQVQVQEISLLSQSNDTAKVDVQIAYVIGDRFEKERPLRLTLVWNDSIKNWQINDTEKL